MRKKVFSILAVILSFLIGTNLIISHNQLNDYTFSFGAKTYAAPMTSNIVSPDYDTSGSGGRKIVKLANGWFISAVKKTTAPYDIIFYKSQDHGESWTQLCYMSSSLATTSHALTSYGNIVYLLLASDTKVEFAAIDAATQANTDIASNAKIVDSGQLSIGPGSSIESNQATGVLNATWCSKNSLYPNSFNIRHAKSIDGGATWTKQDGTAGIDQLTTHNSNTIDATTPCIVVKDSKPVIIWGYISGGFSRLDSINYTGSNWSNVVIVHDAGNFSKYQKNPSAIVSSDGSIHVSWQGYSYLSNCVYNILYSKSVTAGATWAPVQNVTLADKTFTNAGYTVQNSSRNNAQQSLNNVIMKFTPLVDNFTLKKIVEEKIHWAASGTFNTNAKFRIVGGGMDQTITAANNRDLFVNCDIPLTKNVQYTVYLIYNGYTGALYEWGSTTRTTYGDTANVNMDTILCYDESYIDFIVNKSGLLDQVTPSIASDKQNNIYVMWSGASELTAQKYNLYKRVLSGGTWGAVTKLTNNTTGNINSPSTCSNYTSFTDPACIYQDSQAGVVRYLGDPNNLPAISVISPTQNSTFYPRDSAVKTQISVSDADNDTLTCKYFIDSETTPREIVTVSDTLTPKTISFNTSIDMNTLSDGNHTIRYEVSEGFSSVATASINIRVNKAPYKYQYDPSGRLIQLGIYSSNVKVIKYSYDSNGNLTKKQTLYLNPPASLAVTNTNCNNFTLTWSAVNGATGYKIYRNGQYILTTSSTQFVDTNLQPNISYTYDVSALINSDEGNKSSITTVTTP